MVLVFGLISYCLGPALATPRRPSSMCLAGATPCGTHLMDAWSGGGTCVPTELQLSCSLLRNSLFICIFIIQPQGIIGNSICLVGLSGMQFLRTQFVNTHQVLSRLFKTEEVSMVMRGDLFDYLI